MEFKIRFLFVLLTCIGSSAKLVLGDVESNLTSSEAMALSKTVSCKAFIQELHEGGSVFNSVSKRKWNVQEAKIMLLKAIQWRKENNIDNIIEEKVDVEPGMPYTLGSFDREQRPIGILQVGKWKIRRIVVSGKSSQMERVVYKFLEQMNQKSLDTHKADGKNVTQVYVIIDLNGFNNREHICLRCAPLAFQIPVYDSYYPELIHKLVCVNAPRIFENIWEQLKPSMSENSQKHFLLYGTNKADWNKVLATDIAKNQIPVYLGGTYAEGRALSP